MLEVKPVVSWSARFVKMVRTKQKKNLDIEDVLLVQSTRSNNRPHDVKEEEQRLVDDDLLLASLFSSGSSRIRSVRIFLHLNFSQRGKKRKDPG